MREKVRPAAGFAVSAFERHAKELHRYLARRLRRQPQDVEDLAQEVFLRLLRVPDDKCVHKPLAFLYKVAAGAVADYREEEQHQEHVMIDSDTADQRAERPSHVDPDELADRVALVEQLERAIGQLPPTQQAVLLLHKRDELTYQEVASTLGLSIDTVHKYLTVAKARVRGALRDSYK